MINSAVQDAPLTIIKPRKGWQVVDFKELKDYRDLFFFLVLRDVKILYAQTILGFAWAILNPVFQILIFTTVFGKVAKIYSDGVPYMLFCSVAIIPWTYISQALTQSGQSLILGQDMLGKVYFPRLLFPLTAVFSKLVDFAISLVILLGVLVYYHVKPSWNILLLPVFIIMMIGVPAALGIWLSSLAIRFRDVKFAMEFVVRMLMYTAPIVYSASSIPKNYRFIYSINPLVGVTEGMRACLIGTRIPWEFIWPGVITTVVLLIGSALYFRRTERVFADVI